MKDIKRILVATDLSNPSMKAMDCAVVLAEKFGAELLLVYVAEDRLPPVGMIEYPVAQLDQIVEQHKKRARERLEEFAGDVAEKGVACRVDVTAGIPHQEIVALATKHEVDLIVMATHGRGFISHAILGSTTERVLRHAPCPVFAVRETS